MILINMLKHYNFQFEFIQYKHDSGKLRHLTSVCINVHNTSTRTVAHTYAHTVIHWNWKSKIMKDGGKWIYMTKVQRSSKWNKVNCHRWRFFVHCSCPKPIEDKISNSLKMIDDSHTKCFERCVFVLALVFIYIHDAPILRVGWRNYY